ncbi:hypothetical protein A2V61_01765 [Candidatus Woesebacteria bacterium RBG_19FT_COMBO_47_8]|uniref:Uncharacterized protein n=1 Tax=Candidatus Woesebacteria bacterium RBG_13_46_13 TaxID=1802479 RepID=A0A1F7X4Y6_9BACT|nr:MAG: hypothetical protein A2Y68_01860 [Candidatus Woesebacteria bacterium RBG_13_46_13]OGM17108.1 MAG: hypothetical protein A2V61_01765 [Candidatus Woesebacteria bacterium RBG_19FT_COMBO_47_8]HJX59328.1 hypothetical protein [Patescibacteria group bacterium]
MRLKFLLHKLLTIPLPSAFVLTIALVIHSLLSTPLADAQVPSPYVSCEDTDSPEFHSLRPYQKSPCNQEVTETATFCGNRLVLSDKVTAIQTTPPRLANNCTAIGGGRYRCTYTVSGKTANYEIDLANAHFPILGNTEDVANSQQSTDMNDADKMNEYVSWYLNGATGRAESSPLSQDEEDIRKLVDFSGPIKKLLPFDIQNNLRANTVKKAVATKEGDGDLRHDQVVGCTYGVRILGKVIGGIPGACYETGLRGVLPHIEHRLSEWNSHLPPKSSDFDNFQDYWKKYREWQGKICFEIEIPFMDNKKVLLCGENPLAPNYYSNLFANIPFSSTEDRVGEVAVNSQSVAPASEGLEISNVSLVTTPAELYFSHTEEVAELASILQLTFAPAGASTTGGATGVSPGEACDLKEIRTNPGDNLFAESITGDLKYDASFSCDFDGNASSSACAKDVSIGLGVITETPKADELWSRLVAGPAGIFKRIFPKVGEGGAILGILDMPGATGVTYSGSGLVSAGNPQGRAGESAELYFPHVGGISEYFLKGIQTILRPKGFGEQILSGAEGTFGSSGEIDCNEDAPNVSLRGTLNRQATFQLALNWVSGQSGNHVMECYNDVVKRSKSEGFNSALALLIWLNESNASNYNLSVEDFGIHSSSVRGFSAQIDQLLQLPSYYRGTFPQCYGRGMSDIEAFLRIFKSGNCTSSDGANYYSNLRSRWSWVSPGCSFPRSPTDTTCP